MHRAGLGPGTCSRSNSNSKEKPKKLQNVNVDKRLLVTQTLKQEITIICLVKISTHNLEEIIKRKIEKKNILRKISENNKIIIKQDEHNFARGIVNCQSDKRMVQYIWCMWRKI